MDIEFCLITGSAGFWDLGDSEGDAAFRYHMKFEQYTAFPEKSDDLWPSAWMAQDLREDGCYLVAGQPFGLYATQALSYGREGINCIHVFKEKGRASDEEVVGLMQEMGIDAEGKE